MALFYILAAVLVPRVIFADAGACDINSADAKTCCKCDTGSMCLSGSSAYWTCSQTGCYQQEQCTPYICDPAKNNLAVCPAAKAGDFACASAGSISAKSESDGAAYLEICGADYTVNKAQCSLTARQENLAACLESQKNGWAGAQKITFGKDSYSIPAYDPAGKSTEYVNCTDLLGNGTAKSKEDYEKEIKAGLGEKIKDVQLACCLTADHCQSYGCDKDIVYDFFYGCTKIDFGKQLIVKKSDGSSCAVCSPGTFGCGEDLTTQNSSGVYAYKKCETNDDTAKGAPKGCWAARQIDCIQGDANQCASFCTAVVGKKMGVQIWDALAAQNLAAQKSDEAVAFSATPCFKTKCFNAANSGQIKVWDGASKAPNCNYVGSTDSNLRQCQKCHDDVNTSTAVCDLVYPPKLSVCAPGTALCGNSCYNYSHGQRCIGGAIRCPGDSGHNPFICDSGRNSIARLEPVLISNETDGDCRYNYYQVCGLNQKCSVDHCVADTATPAGRESVAIPGQYKDGKLYTLTDNWKSGVLIDRVTGKPMDPDTANYFKMKYSYMTKYSYSAGGVSSSALVCDKIGCDTLNGALALIASSSIKDREYKEQLDAKGNVVVGSGTYMCINYAYDTEKMLRDNNIDAYTVVMGITSASGEYHGHAAVAIPVAEVQYPNGVTVPVFAVVDPQDGSLRAIIGYGGGNSIVNAYNDSGTGFSFRVDNAAVIDNYEIGPGGEQILNKNSTVWTYTTNHIQPGIIGANKYIVTNDYTSQIKLP